VLLEAHVQVNILYAQGFKQLNLIPNHQEKVGALLYPGMICKQVADLQCQTMV
jgi:hypothetical protein